VNFRGYVTPVLIRIPLPNTSTFTAGESSKPAFFLFFNFFTHQTSFIMMWLFLANVRSQAFLLSRRRLTESPRVLRSMANAPKTPNAQHWGNEHIDAAILVIVVVVGGSLIGLCTAYNLAKALGSQQKLKITVLRGPTVDLHLCLVSQYGVLAL
jgi:hypothetical protein